MTAKKTTAATAELDRQIAADASEQDVAPDALARITDATGKLLELDAYIAGLERELKKHEEERRRLAESVLPSLMDEADVASLTLADGVSVLRSEQVFASIAKANAEAATSWLIAHGHGALVKDAFTIPLDKGDTKLAAKVTALLTKAGIGFERRSSVHPQTLVAFVKESLAQGRSLPKAITHHVQPCIVIKAKRK